MVMRDAVHTIPADHQAEHDTDGLMCWCVPRFYLPCDECEDGCWKCIEGLIELNVAQAEATDQGIVIVHNR